MSLRKIAVVYNADSGPSAGGRLDDQLADALAQHGVAATYRAFDPANVGSDVGALLAASPDAIFVAGGDGTVTSVAEHVLGRNVPLGVVPTGTMNVLARDLGVPDDLAAAVEALVAAPVRAIDVGRVNGQLFLCSSALALLPHLGRLRERSRATTGWALVRLWTRGLRLVRRYPRMRLHVVVDGHEHLVRTRAIVVSNNPMSDGPAPLPSRELLDTGRFAVYVTRDRTRWDLLGIAAKLLDGSWQQAERLSSHEGRIVDIASSQLERMSVMNDGEVTQLTMPLRYELHHKVLDVLAPRTTP